MLFTRFHGKRDGSREAGDDARFLAKPVHGPVQVSITRQMLDPVHRKRHPNLVFPGNHVLRQQVLGSESDEMAVPGYQVHRWRSKERRDERVRRIVIHLHRRSQLPHPTALHDGNPIAEAHRLRLVVGYIDRRGPDALLKSLELITSTRAQLGVEIGQRLVQQEDLWVPDHCSCQCDALPFPTGELPRAAAEQLIDAQQLRSPAGLAFAFWLIELGSLEWKDDVVKDRLVRIQGVTLEHHGNAPQSGRQAVDDIAANKHLTVGGILEAGDGTQQRGLAAARRA